MDIFNAVTVRILLKHYLIKHQIELKLSMEPLWSLVYPLRELKLKALQQYLNSSLERGWIHKSTSLAKAPILFVLKKDKGLQLCINYCSLNKVMMQNCTLLLLINKMLNKLKRFKVFTKLNLKDAYHYI
jgi:hypothetical protein